MNESRYNAFAACAAAFAMGLFSGSPLGEAGWICVVAALVLAAIGVSRAFKVRASSTVSTPVQPASQTQRFNLTCVAPSYAVLKPGSTIRLLQVAIPNGSVDLELSTRYLDGWGPVQNGVVAEARGFTGEDSPIQALSRPLADVAAVLSLSANAWVGNLIAAESIQPPSDGQLARTTSGHRLADPVRDLDEEATAALLDSVSVHPDSSTVWEALHCYWRALACWTPELQSVALAHLHHGMVTMVEAMIRFLSESQGRSRSAVAKRFGVREDDLAAHVLESEIYRDDLLCFQAAKLAWQTASSAGSPAGADSYPVEDAPVAAARYLRSSILRVLEPKEPCCSRLFAAPYDVPLGLSDQGTASRQLQDYILPRGIAARRPGIQPRPGFGT